MEWAQYIEANQHLSKLSQRTYETNYKKLRYGLEELHKVSEQDIVDYLDGLQQDKEINTNTYVNILGVAIQVRRHYEADVEKLMKQKLLYSEKVKQQRQQKNVVMLEETKTEKDLLNHLELLFREENWRDYLINFLLIHFHVRNKDLNIVITDSITAAKADISRNYLVVVPSYATYIRNDFKTSGKYGAKKDRIQTSKFRFALDNFIEERGGLSTGHLYLLSTGVNMPIGEDSVQKYVAHKTLDKIGQSAYNKIIVTEAAKRKDLKKLREISTRRGTSLEVLLDYYDLSF